MKTAIHTELGKVVNISKYTYAVGAAAGVFYGSYKRVTGADKTVVTMKPAAKEPPKTHAAVA